MAYVFSVRNLQHSPTFALDAFLTPKLKDSTCLSLHQDAEKREDQAKFQQRSQILLRNKVSETKIERFYLRDIGVTSCRYACVNLPI